MGLFDLSALIAPSPEGVSDFLRIDIAYHTHTAGAEQAQAIFKVPPSVFRNSEGWATETITNLETHSTTHIDAPWHYNSVIQGRRAQTIDELPLEWFFNDGVVLDMVHKTDWDAITAGEMQQELEKIGYELKPLDIVLIRTRRDKVTSQ